MLATIIHKAGNIDFTDICESLKELMEYPFSSWEGFWNCVLIAVIIRVYLFIVHW